MDLVFLSRLQFALTIMFHYLFPPLSIGLGLIMVITEGRFLRDRRASLRGPGALLDPHLRGQLRRRRRHGHRHGVRVRHQLGHVLALRRRRVRLRARRRGHLRLLPRVRLSGRAGLRLGPGLAPHALLLDADGVPRLDVLGRVDRDRQLMAADARRLSHRRARRRGPGRDHRLLGDGVQPVQHASPRPCAARQLHPGLVLRAQRVRLVHPEEAPRGSGEAELPHRACRGRRQQRGHPAVRPRAGQGRGGEPTGQARRVRRPLQSGARRHRHVPVRRARHQGRTGPRRRLDPGHAQLSRARRRLEARHRARPVPRRRAPPGPDPVPDLPPDGGARHVLHRRHAARAVPALGESGCSSSAG